MSKPILCPKCGEPIKVILMTQITGTNLCYVFDDGIEEPDTPPNVDAVAGIVQKLGRTECPKCGTLSPKYRVKKDENGLYAIFEQCGRAYEKGR